MIDRATIDKIMDATNIVDVVGEFVTLRKAGVNYKGLCPFHDDTTPSFMVSPSKQICKCFACGEGGTAINFLMKHEQITYPEALRWLAKKYNIEVEEKELTEEERKEQSARESMFIVNEWAMKYFQNILKNDPDGIAIGKQYFRSRGIRDDIIEKFNLGKSRSDDLIQLKCGLNPFLLPCCNYRPCDLRCKWILAVFSDDPCQFLSRIIIYDILSCLTAVLIHSHIKRCIFSVGEAPVLVIKLIR